MGTDGDKIMKHTPLALQPTYYATVTGCLDGRPVGGGGDEETCGSHRRRMGSRRQAGSLRYDVALLTSADIRNPGAGGETPGSRKRKPGIAWASLSAQMDPAQGLGKRRGSGPAAVGFDGNSGSMTRA